MKEFVRYVSDDSRSFSSAEECVAYEEALKALKKAESEYKIALKAFKEKYAFNSCLPATDGWEKLWVSLF